MATKKKTEVATVSPNELAVAGDRPDFMKRGSKRGIETMSSEDFELAQVGLLQALSPQVEKQGLRAGFLYHNILEAVLQDAEGSNELTLVPIMNRIRYVLWNPRHLGGGQLATASDGVNWDVPDQVFEVKLDEDDEYKEHWRIGKTVRELTMCEVDGKFTKSIADFGTFDIRKDGKGGQKQSAPAATKSYNFLCVASNRLELGPFIVFLQKTSEKVGKRWNQMIRAADADAFGQVFKLAGEYKDEGPKKKYWKYTITGAGFVQDAQQFQAFEGLYDHYASMESWNIKEEPEADAEDNGPVIEGEVSEEM